MNALPVWKCDFTDTKDLTVGSKFKANCAGDIPVNWQDGPLGLVFPSKEAEYSLVILEAAKVESNAVELILTGYKAGEHAPEYVRIVQGEQGFEVQKPQWQIQTVLKQGQENKPYPPFGPWNLALPYWFMAAVVVVVIAIGILLARFIRRRTQRRRMLTDLEKHKTALSPLHQFYRDARQIRRRLNQVKSDDDVREAADDLNREFRLYVLREFQIPTLDWSNRAILSDLRRRHRRVHRKAGDELGKTLRELARMKAHSSVLLKDVEQIYRMSMDSVEKLAKAREEMGRGGRR